MNAVQMCLMDTAQTFRDAGAMTDEDEARFAQAMQDAQ